jgi:hypothetical protein
LESLPELPPKSLPSHAVVLLQLFCCHKCSIMPRGKQYTEKEKLLIAQAYAWATNDEIRGVEQKMSEFMGRVKTFLMKNSPNEFPRGTFHEREDSALERFISAMKKDVAKFMATLRKVLLVDWSGLDHTQKVNIAVACYVGKADKPHYDWKNFDARQWANYGPYEVLCKLPQFQIPSVPSPPVTSITLDDENGIDSVLEDDRSSLESTSVISCAKKTPLKRQASRGGVGVKKAKQEMLDATKERIHNEKLDKLNENMEKLVEETRRNILSKKEDREMFELATVLDHCQDTQDIADALENKVRNRLNLPKKATNETVVDNPSRDSHDEEEDDDKSYDNSADW